MMDMQTCYGPCHLGLTECILLHQLKWVLLVMCPLLSSDVDLVSRERLKIFLLKYYRKR